MACLTVFCPFVFLISVWASFHIYYFIFSYCYKISADGCVGEELTVLVWKWLFRLSTDMSYVCMV